MEYIFNSKEEISNLHGQIKNKESIDWVCGKCKKHHHEKEFRNLERRMFPCQCYRIENRLNEMDAELKKYNFITTKRVGTYTISKNGSVDNHKPIEVKCLKCGSIYSKSSFATLANGCKKCNCNPSKKFNTNISTNEFIDKWSDITKQNFELCENETYINRNTKYKVKCKKCGKISERWGISLIDNDNTCLYCNDNGSKGEQRISLLLDKYNINYEREKVTNINNHKLRFDFYLPDLQICLEYNGQQHYEAFEYFGGEEKLKQTKMYDKYKQEWCNKNNILLITFKYNDSWENIEKVISNLKFND